MITSKQNPTIQLIRRLQREAASRRSEGAFVIEGVRLVEEALQAGVSPRQVLHLEEVSPRSRAALGECSRLKIAVESVSAEVMQAASDTQHAQDILAIVPRQTPPLPASLEMVLIPDGVRDPGNLGTILRTAAAAGVSAVFLPPGGVDPFAPKVLRGAMGAHFRLPIVEFSWENGGAGGHASHNLPALPAAVAALPLFRAETGAALLYTDADLRAPFALIIGGEAFGAGPEVQRLPATPIAIPMPGGSESLNAAVAAAVILFEAVRQRDHS